MRNNLLEFLFGTRAVKVEAAEDKLGEQLLRVFEEMEALDDTEIEVVDKKPLGDALKALDVDAKVEPTEGWAEIHFDEPDEYRAACAKIFSPEGYDKLASMGWVPSWSGDVAMANEEPDLKIGFTAVAVAGSSDKDKPEPLKSVMKKGRERDTTEQDRDDDPLNPVENEDGEMGEKKTGVGKEKEGADPEGTPKGSKKVKEGRSAQQVADALLEVTTAGAVPMVSMPPLEMGMPGGGLETKGRGGKKLGSKFKMPGQWRQSPAITPKKKK